VSFEARGTGWVIAVLTLAFYPYVYLLARAAFLAIGRGTLEAARLLGLGGWGTFFRVVLPTARPAIVAGVALALMETLADFGAVSVFNYDTFTTAIYKAWFGLFNLPAAAQLASLLLLIVALALVGERRLRGAARFHETARGRRRPASRWPAGAGGSPPRWPAWWWGWASCCRWSSSSGGWRPRTTRAWTTLLDPARPHPGPRRQRGVGHGGGRPRGRPRAPAAADRASRVAVEVSALGYALRARSWRSAS